MKNKYIKYYLIAIFGWTLLIVSLLIFEFYKIKEEIKNAAQIEARANFNKDQAIRFWAASHGGVYVPIDSLTQPHPALSHILERDIETPSGVKLTLMNPAYMIRQLNEYFAEYYGIIGHITSKKLLRPENKPDEWELNALNQFEEGVKEINNLSDINGEPYLRLMQPIMINQTCLKCHSHQGYKVGDVRGGVGISIPMKPILERALKHKKRSIFTFVIIWLVGLIVFTFGHRKIVNSLHKRHKAELKLQKQNEEYASLNEEYTSQNEALKTSIINLERSKEKYRLLSETSTDIIVVQDLNGKIKYMNKAGIKLSEHSNKEVINMNISDFFSEKFTNEVLSRRKKREELDLSLFNYEIDFISKNSNIIPLEISSIPIITDKDINDILIVGRDITESKKAKLELKRQNRELIKAKEKAEESDRLKTEFINNMSHEIRTPMNGILGFSKVLERPNLSEEKRKHYIKIIQNSGNQLMQIIDDILEISKLETKQVKAIEEEVNLNNLLIETFAIFDIRAKENGTPLYLHKNLSDKESIILTDPTKLNKILSNLLENALKFTNEGFIEFGYNIVEKEEGSFLQIFVKDTGIGIKPENQEIIFKRFSQEEKELSQKVGGLGLGLSIAKENTEILGGKITLKSVKGKGSTFFVTIPYKPVIHQNSFNNKGTTNKTEKTILITEDEEINYLYISLLIETIDSKIKILHAKNGEEAIEICKKNKKINLVLMDLKMPVMNGFKATKKIKELCPDLPIVAQTAYTRQEEKEEAFFVGCIDFLSKPISEVNLTKILKKHLIIK